MLRYAVQDAFFRSKNVYGRRIPKNLFGCHQITQRQLQAKCATLVEVLEQLPVSGGSIGWAVVCLDRCVAEVMHLFVAIRAFQLPTNDIVAGRDGALQVVAVFAVVACDHLRLLCVNPALPRDTQQQILSQVEPAVIITSSDADTGSAILSFGCDTPTLLVDPLTGDVVRHSGGLSHGHGYAREELDDVFYMTFTSGSSGRAKGVLNTWAGALNRFEWMWSELPFEGGDVLARRTPFGFVDCVWEIFGGLLRGIPLFIPSESALHDLRQLCEELAAAKVSRLTLVPSQLRAILMIFDEADITRLFAALRILIVSGEPFPAADLERVAHPLPHVTVINLYGALTPVRCCHFGALFAFLLTC